MGVSKVLTQLLADLGTYASPSLSQIGAAARGGDKIPTKAMGDFSALFNDDEDVLKLANALSPPMPKLATAGKGMPVELYPANKNAAREKLAGQSDDTILSKLLAEFGQDPLKPIPPMTTDDVSAALNKTIAEEDTGQISAALQKAADDADARWRSERDADTARVRKTAEARAEEVLQALKEGRAEDLTDADFAMRDGRSQMFFDQYLFNNYDLPMDPESRAQRAHLMGYGEQPWYRGSGSNSANPRADTLFSADGPDVAWSYASKQGGNIAPLRFQDTPRDVNYSPAQEGTLWSRLPMTQERAALTTRGGDVIDPTTLAQGSVSTDSLIGRLMSEGYISDTEPGSVTFENIIDLSSLDNAPSDLAGNIRATPSKLGVRSQFARFDPRLSHIKNLSAGAAGAATLPFALGAPIEAEAAAMPQRDIGADLLASMNRFVENMPSRRPQVGDLPLIPEDAPTLEAYDPTIRDRIAYTTEDLLKAFGAPDAVARRAGRNVAGSEVDPNVGAGGMGLADLVPILGSVMGVEEGRNALDQGRNLDAALMLGGAALEPLSALASPAVRRSVGEFARSEAGNIGLRRGRRTGPAYIDEDAMPVEVPTPGIGDNSGVRPRVRTPLDSVDLPPGSDPRYVGAAPVRTEPYPRYTPKRTPERMSRLEARVNDPNDPIRGMFDRYIEKGRELGGPDWYNTEELRDWFVGSLGEAEGDKQWREYLELIGTTSTGAKVPTNIRVASFYRALNPEDRARVADLVNKKGITPVKAARELGIEVPNLPDDYQYGHIKQRNQASNVVNREEGRWARTPPPELKGAELTKWLQANPKVKGFGNNLLGDDQNIAADMHFMRMLAMSDGGGDFLTQQAKLSADAMDIARQAIGPRKLKKYVTSRQVNGKTVSEVNLRKAWENGDLKDPSVFKGTPTAWADTPSATEYAAYENMARRVAEEYGMTPAQFQASLWMGAGDMTGLADESQGTFMELFRRSLDKRAKERGLSRREMLEDFIMNRAPLAIGPLGAIGLLNTQQPEQRDGT